MKLSDLPEVTFVDADTETVQNNIVTIAEGILGRTLARADPLRLFLNSLALIIVQQRKAIDTGLKQNLLAYTSGNYMDHLGNFVTCERITATAATTTVQVTLSAAQTSAVIVPKGTRITAEDGTTFAVSADITVLAGETTATGKASCTTTGDAGNGYEAGKVNIIIDKIPYVSAISNTTTTEGGADTEDDEDYRTRIQEAPEKFSTAGPDGAYKYWAKQASSLVSDVEVTSPDPGVVLVTVLLENGELPGEEMLETVANTVNSKSVRPLTDKVKTAAPTVVNYDIDLKYYIDSEDATIQASIKNNVEAAISDWIIWQKSKLGRDINVTELTYRIRASGAKWVEVTSPVNTVIDATSVAIANNININYGGLQDE
ncbi:baseplate J/gp47 family protein [Megasphaera sp.]|uniref:baseplate assembly protein n=1 Tax=Megasphaera sp. TaxID=2023260 RepID=UPI003521E7CF|nr:baseplate J/gp47 family protein [Megasphaera elsdenii]